MTSGREEGFPSDAFSRSGQQSADFSRAAQQSAAGFTRQGFNYDGPSATPQRHSEKTWAGQDVEINGSDDDGLDQSGQYYDAKMTDYRNHESHKYDFAGHLQLARPEGGREGGAVELGEGEGRHGWVTCGSQEPEGEGAGDGRD